MSPKGLRPIDPQRDLMPGADVPNAARAFEFHEDWSLALQATRYQLEEVKRTSIDRAFVRMVVTRGDQVAVQALYRLRSARQRVPLKIPGVDPKNTAGVLDSQPLRINNQSAPLEHDGTQFFHSAHGAFGRRAGAGRAAVHRAGRIRRRCSCPNSQTIRPCSRCIWRRICRKNGSCSASAGRGRMKTGPAHG